MENKTLHSILDHCVVWHAPPLPPAADLVHRRQNGKFFLETIAHPRFGLPSGQDRLIPIWAATLAVKQKSRTVHFDSAAQLLEFLHLPKDGIHYRRIVEGFSTYFRGQHLFRHR